MNLASHIDLLRHELRVLGPWLFATPLIALIALGGLAEVLATRGMDSGFVTNLLDAALEACLPLAGALVICTLTARDAALELQLTLPVHYRATVLRRVALILVWTGLVALTGTVVFRVTLPGTRHLSMVADQLTWFAPTLSMAGAGALLALLLRSSAAAAATLGMLWVIQLAFHGYFLTYGWGQPWFLFTTLFDPTAAFWLTNRLELIAIGVALLGILWWYLRRPEWRFRAEEN